MSLVNQGQASAALQAATQTLLDAYNAYFDATTSSVDDLVNVTPISSRAFLHAFIADMPIERRWSGEKQFKSMSVKYISGEVEDFELSISLAYKDVISGNLNPWIQQSSNLGARMKRFNDRRVAEILNNSTSTDPDYLNYDGLALASTSHVGGSNNHTGSGLSFANLQQVWEAGVGMADENGVTLNRMPTHLVVPTALWSQAIGLMEDSLINDGTVAKSNTMKGRLKVVHLPELTSSTTWFLVDASNNKPFTLHQLQGPELAVQDSIGSEAVFRHGECQYSLTAYSKMKAGVYQQFQRAIE